jgi:hypothetical protein
MVSERWKQIEQVYYSVVSSSVADRAALLDELCSNDLDMRREVESLLNARDDAGNFLSSMTLKGHLTELLFEPDPAGQTVGHYQVL